MNEGAAKAARRAARAHGLMPGCGLAHWSLGPRLSGTRPIWKLPRAVARDYQALSHRERGRQRVTWDRVAFCLDVESHPSAPRSRF